MAGPGDEDDMRAQTAREEQEAADDLERRLRDMQWPAPPPDVRERALADFQARIEKLRSEQSVTTEPE